MEKVGFVTCSDNRKTGGIPVSTTSARTCPSSCPLRLKGCYARLYPLLAHWRKVTSGERGLSWDDFLEGVRSLPEGTLWRHAQAGDLPGQGDRLDVRKLGQLAEANRGRKGYTYTHKPLRRVEEQVAVSQAVKEGFTINLSADNLVEADSLLELGIAPVVSIIPFGSGSTLRTPKGNLVRLCRHQACGTKCTDCRVCARRRKFIVGFLPHGGQARAVDAVARGYTQ